MPSLPLDPRPDRARSDAAPAPAPAPADPASAARDDATVSPAVATAAGARAPEAVPVDPETERARWRDRRTGLIALVVVTIALWAVIAAAVGFATTM
ncbi:hypothetical protein [Clavibacter zhangzhiyongii]|uniref:Uncharacterized protein n=1 Tax=Clavibacter zhangzhiyongii TaxID=2768071 RepID=A0A7L7Z635_9MICO|nr:hypothetical protein [Clavibacter zhangzhiyongii]QOD45085.1 hypothetical protein H9X71_07215 [Clavibacter zhangzhiyongii]